MLRSDHGEDNRTARFKQLTVFPDSKCILCSLHRLLLKTCWVSGGIYGEQILRLGIGLAKLDDNRFCAVLNHIRSLAISSTLKEHTC